jgi:hypothetical protein
MVNILQRLLFLTPSLLGSIFILGFVIFFLSFALFLRSVLWNNVVLLKPVSILALVLSIRFLPEDRPLEDFEHHGREISIVCCSVVNSKVLRY